MALAREDKAQVVQTYKQHNTDTASPEVQVALLTKRIKGLTEHFKAHKLDHHSRRGLLLMVSRRKRLLAYLKRKSETRYKQLIQSLGLRK